MALFHTSESASLLAEYCLQHSTATDPLLQELERMTGLRTMSPQMCSGALQGSLLQMIVTLAQPKLAIEIGTFTGYSAICIGRGLPAGARLISYEINPEIAYISREFVAKANLADQIDLQIGDALIEIPKLTENIDFVFMDGRKSMYPEYYQAVLPRLNPGGLIIADNTLWSGKVLESKRSSETEIIHQFNRDLAADPRVKVVILPFRDGLSLIHKL